MLGSSADGPIVATAGTHQLELINTALGFRDRRAVTFRAGWEWVAVEGPVTIIGPDDVPAGYDIARLPQLLRDVFTAAGGTHGDWDEFDRVMAAEGRIAVLVEPVRITSNS